MARKQQNVPVPEWPGNRDWEARRVYRITEMPAEKSEKWAMRVFVALKGAGSEIPESAARLGMAGITLGFINAFLRADIDPDKLEPLLDQMMDCVQIIRDPKKHPDIATDLVSDDDIEEPQTRLWLRSEVIRLHTNFSVSDALFSLISATTPAGTSSST
jgi:hypothetical protein